MAAEIQPRRGPGKFQWNAGAWFGNVLAGTGWIIVTAGFLVVNLEFAVAAIPLGCCLITFLVACGLWQRREQLDPFFSRMLLLSVLAIATPVAWIATRELASPGTLAQMNWPASARWDVVISLVVPVGMLGFYIVEGRANRKQSASSQQRSADGI